MSWITFVITVLPIIALGLQIAIAVLTVITYKDTKKQDEAIEKLALRIYKIETEQDPERADP